MAGFHRISWSNFLEDEFLIRMEFKWQFSICTIALCIVGASSLPSSWPAREILMKDWELSTQNSIGIVDISFFVFSNTTHIQLSTRLFSISCQRFYDIFIIFKEQAWLVDRQGRFLTEIPTLPTSRLLYDDSTMTL